MFTAPLCTRPDRHLSDACIQTEIQWSGVTIWLHVVAVGMADNVQCIAVAGRAKSFMLSADLFTNAENIPTYSWFLLFDAIAWFAGSLIGSLCAVEILLSYSGRLSMNFHLSCPSLHPLPSSFPPLSSHSSSTYIPLLHLSPSLITLPCLDFLLPLLLASYLRVFRLDTQQRWTQRLRLRLYNVHTLLWHLTFEWPTLYASLHHVFKKTTLMLHTITSTNINRFS